MKIIYPDDRPKRVGCIIIFGDSIAIPKSSAKYEDWVSQTPLVGNTLFKDGQRAKCDVNTKVEDLFLKSQNMTK